MDATTLHYLVKFGSFQRTDYAAYECGHTYLYGDLDMEINPSQVAPDHGARLLRLQRSLYGLNQSGRTWYTRLSDYLIGRG